MAAAVNELWPTQSKIAFLEPGLNMQDVWLANVAWRWGEGGELDLRIVGQAKPVNVKVQLVPLQCGYYSFVWNYGVTEVNGIGSLSKNHFLKNHKRW